MLETQDGEVTKHLMDAERSCNFVNRNEMPGIPNSPVFKEEKEMHNCLKLENKLRDLEKKFFILVIVFGVGLVGIIVLAVVLSMVFRHQILNHTHKPNIGVQVAKILDNEPLCVRCGDLRLGPSPQEDNLLNSFKRRTRNKVEECCIETPGQLLKMIDLSIEMRYRQEQAKSNVKFYSPTDGAPMYKRPSAHLLGSGDLPTFPAVPGGQFPITRWIYNEDIAFIDNFGYRIGRLVVLEDGLYFVYSQISYLEFYDVAGDSRGTPHSISHYLYRYNINYREGGEELLAHNSITKCHNSDRAFGEYASYIGAVLKLRKGDEVFVKVSNLTIVSRDHKQNYFGIFRL